MEKIDHKKELKHFYKPSAKKVEIVDVPKMSFLMIDGEGDPNNTMTRLSIILFSTLLIFTSQAYAHGGPEFAAMVILIWGLVPILIISLAVLPLSLLIGKLFHIKRKWSVTSGVVVTILIYLLAIPHLQSIINWVLDLQYYFD